MVDVRKCSSVFIHGGGSRDDGELSTFEPSRSTPAFLGRHLQSTNDGSSSSNSIGPDGPMAILIMVFILVCFIWTPMIVQRHCRRRRAEEEMRTRREQEGHGIMGPEEEAAAEFIRMSLNNFNLNFGTSMGTTSHQNSTGELSSEPETLYNFSLRTMTLENRKEYVQNLLVSKQILKILETPDVEAGGTDKTDDEVNDGEPDLDQQQPDGNNNNINGTSKSTTIDILVGEEIDLEKTSKVNTADACPICLVEYEEGDVLCWSQSGKCIHAFHKQCMVEWLLRNEECPLCRHNYLSLEDDDEDADNDNDEDTGNRRMSNRTPLPTSSAMLAYSTRYGTTASPTSHNLRLQHPHHSLVVPRASSGQRREDDASYLRGFELAQLLQSLQLLSETRQNASVRLDGLELAYPNHTNNFTALHQTRSRQAPQEIRGQRSAIAEHGPASNTETEQHPDANPNETTADDDAVVPPSAPSR